MKNFLMLTFCASFMTLTAGCASFENYMSKQTHEGEYVDIVEEYSDKASSYSGLYNTVDVQGTLLNSKVLSAQEQQLGRLYQWDEKKAADEKTKNVGRLGKETEVFLAFYTPERKSDDLNKNNSQWRLFLDVSGHRYEGKVTKLKTPPSELTIIYPGFNRFYTPYSVVFNVPAKNIEGATSKLTVTGAVGSAVLNFKAIGSTQK